MKLQKSKSVIKDISNLLVAAHLTSLIDSRTSNDMFIQRGQVERSDVWVVICNQHKPGVARLEYKLKRKQLVTNKVPFISGAVSPPNIVPPGCVVEPLLFFMSVNFV